MSPEDHFKAHCCFSERAGKSEERLRSFSPRLSLLLFSLIGSGKRCLSNTSLDVMLRAFKHYDAALRPSESKGAEIYFVSHFGGALPHPSSEPQADRLLLLRNDE